jgi:hypothetical protein
MLRVPLETREQLSPRCLVQPRAPDGIFGIGAVPVNGPARG